MLSLKINFNNHDSFSKFYVVSFARLNCGVTALFGPMMECVGLGTVVSVSAQIMNFPNHSKSLTVAFLQKIWSVKKENQRPPLIEPLTPKFSRDGSKLIIHGQLMMRRIMVRYFASFLYIMLHLVLLYYHLEIYLVINKFLSCSSWDDLCESSTKSWTLHWLYWWFS